MEESKAQVKLDQILNDLFHISNGVRQGDGLSAILFVIVLHHVMKHLPQRVTKFNKSTQISAYADVIGLIARSKHRLVEMLKDIQEKLKEVERQRNAVHDRISG